MRASAAMRMAAGALGPRKFLKRPFKPTDVAGNVLWLAADKAVTLVGSKVSAWGDQSPSALVAAESTDARRPTYNATRPALGGRPSFSYVAASQQRLVTGAANRTQPAMVYVVGSITGAASYRGFVGTGTTGALSVGSQSSNGRAVIFAGTLLQAGSSPALTTPAIVIAEFNTTSSKVYQSNTVTPVASGNAGTSTQGAWSIGGDGSSLGWLDGEVAEVLAYSGTHTQAQRFAIAAYLGAKYGLSYS